MIDKIQENMKAVIAVIAILIVGAAGVGGVATSPAVQEQIGDITGIPVGPSGETEVADPNPTNPESGGAAPESGGTGQVEG